jgi:hypothetical protein
MDAWLRCLLFSARIKPRPRVSQESAFLQAAPLTLIFCFLNEHARKLKFYFSGQFCEFQLISTLVTTIRIQGTPCPKAPSSWPLMVSPSPLSPL